MREIVAKKDELLEIEFECDKKALQDKPDDEDSAAKAFISAHRDKWSSWASHSTQWRERKGP